MVILPIGYPGAGTGTSGTGAGRVRRGEEDPVLGLLGLLLVLWLALAVVGAIIEGLFWLLVVGVVLFLATSAWAWRKRDTRA